MTEFGLISLLEILALGGFAGALSGLLGIGGGSVMVPGITLLLITQGMPVDTSVKFALGTSLTTALLTTATASVSHWRNNLLRTHIVRILAPAMLGGAYIGSLLAVNVEGWILSIAIGCYNLCICVQLLASGPNDPQAYHKPMSPVELTSVGGGIGSLSAIFGIGGGSLTVPYLTFRGLTTKLATANSAACASFLCIGGFLGYSLATPAEPAVGILTIGYVDIVMAGCMLLTSVPTAYLVANQVPNMSEKFIRVSFISYLVLVGVGMIWLGGAQS